MIKFALGALVVSAGLAAALAVPAAGGARVDPAAPAQQGTTYVHVGTWPLPPGLLEPLDLAFGPRGDLYIADGYQRVVRALRANGTQWATWPPPLIAEGLVPTVLAYDPARARLYALWQRYDPADGQAEPRPGPLYLDMHTPDGNTDGVLQSLPFLPVAQDAAVDPTTGDLLVLGAGRLFRVRLPAALAGTSPVERAGQQPTRLAVLPDGRVVVGGGGYVGLTVYAGNGVPLADLALPEGSVAALAAGPGGTVYALVHGRGPGAAAAPVLVALEATGTRLGAWSAADLRAPALPAGAWPWSLAVAAEGVAFTSGASHLVVHRLAGDLTPLWVLSGRPVRDHFTPPDARRWAEPTLALALGQAGLEVLDPAAGAVLAFDANGQAGLVAAAPEDALDLAVDEDGRRFVSTQGGDLAQLAASDVITPAWRVACDCDLGGRLAAARGTVYMSQPRGLSVGTVDAALGTVGRSHVLPDAVGLWPSDVAIGPDGRLFTADLVTAQVHAWSGDAAPTAWPAGLLAGPRRIAGGRLADGTPALASLMADGSLALHTLDGNLVARWEPRLATGEGFVPVDVAMDAEGLVWLADARDRAVHLFAPGGGVPATPPAAPTPAPTTDLTCRVVGDKVAGPGTLVMGQTVGVTLTLAADCPARASVVGADVMLVIDRSNSMSSGGLAAAQAAGRAFVELLDVRYHRVGLTSFADDASVDVPLTANVPAVVDGLLAVRPGGQTNLYLAIERAWTNLRDYGRPEALTVLILLTDGQNSAPAADPRPLAAEARNAGVQIYTIGLGSSVDQGLLRELAGRSDRYFAAPSPGDLFPIYGQILRLVLSSLAGNLIIDDLLGDGMAYVESSARPPAVVAFGRLSWGRSLLPATGITMTYRLRPTRAGCQPTNRQAQASYTDADGALRQFVFPVPTVCVTAPTPTATRLPTATPTPTPRPARLHLPITYRNACLPGLAHADVVLLIDTSDSMAGEKLAQAKAAAADFVGLLDLPNDQAAVAGFNATVQLASPLTTSRAALVAALGRLTSARGTQIDRALRAAVNELRGARHRRDNRPVVVLLSDGYHNGDARAVVAVANEARAAGMTVFAIGLGQEYDADLLRAIAGPNRFFDAPDGAALAAIYRQIAGIIPCR